MYTKGQNVVMGWDKVCDCVWERTGCVAQNRAEYVGRERGEVVLWERIRLYCVMWEGTECLWCGREGTECAVWERSRTHLRSSRETKPVNLVTVSLTLSYRFS